MGKWEMVRLGDVATYINGYPFKPSDWTMQGLPIIRIQNLTESSNIINYYDKSYNMRYEINDGDILISWSASLGVYKWGKGKALLNQHIFKVVFDKISFDKRFFKYIIEQKIEEMMRFTHGSTMKHITKKYFDEIQICCPPLPIQQKIVDILDRASALIEKRKAQIKKLDLLIKSQFIGMFGDPVINPMGWEVRRLGDCGSFKNGMNFSQNESGYRIKCLGVGDFGNLYIMDDMDSISEISLSSEPSQDYLLQESDIVFVRSNGNRALVGRSVEVFPDNTRLTYSGFCIRYRNAFGNLQTLYLNHLLHLPSMRFALLGDGRGSNIQNVNQKALSSLAIPIPPLALQTQFSAFVERVEAQKAKMKQGLELLELEYKSLMQKCFSGKTPPVSSADSPLNLRGPLP